MADDSRASILLNFHGTHGSELKAGAGTFWPVYQVLDERPWGVKEMLDDRGSTVRNRPGG